MLLVLQLHRYQLGLAFLVTIINLIVTSTNKRMKAKVDLVNGNKAFLLCA